MTSPIEIIGSNITFLSAQNMAMVAMLRALYLAHPEQEKAKLFFEQLVAQHLAHPACLDDPGIAKTLREMAEILTRPATEGFE